MRFVSLPLVLLCATGALSAEPARDRFGDPLPEGAIARLGSLRLRPQLPVLTGAFSPDGKLLATGGEGGIGGSVVTFWDTATGKEARRLPGKLSFSLHGLRFSADGKSLILVGSDGTLVIVDAATGAEQLRLHTAEQHALIAVDATRDGKTAVTTDFRGNIVVWDLETGKCLRDFKIPRGLVFWTNRTPFDPLTALTPDGKQLVLPQPDGSLHLMNVASGEKVVSFEMPPKQAGSPKAPIVAVSPNGRYLAYGGRWFPATLCDLKTGKRLHSLSDPRKSIFGLLFMPDSRVLAVQEHGEMRFFDTDSGKEVRKLARSSGIGYPLAVSPDGKKLALVDAQHALSLWDVGTGRELHPAVRHVSLVQSVVFFPDGKRLVSSDQSGNRIVWDIASAQILAHDEKVHAYDKPRSLAVDVDGKTVRYLSFGDTILRWNPSEGKTNQQKIPPRSPFEFVLSPDGRTMAATVLPNAVSQVQLYDLQGGKPQRTITIPNKERTSFLMFSADSRRLLTGGADSTMRLWDRDTGRLLRELSAEDPDLRRRPGYGILTHDGRSLAYFDYTLGYHLGIQEIASGGVRLRIDLPKGGGNPLACSPNGRFLACAYLTGGVLVLGTGTGKELARWQGPQQSVYSLAFSPDSRVLACGYGDGTILLWRVPGSEGLPTALKAEEAAALWQTLANSNAARANRALAGLAAAPIQAVPLIKAHFGTPIPSPGAEKMARWIAELDADDFKVRERATNELTAAGPAAADALRKALADKPSVEAEKRIKDLLTRLDSGPSERLRCLRAIEVLERIGTPQAKDALRELGRKSLTAELREEIEATLRRMEKRFPAAPERSRTP